MDSTQRKGINFDLDTEALKEYYPKGDWHNAYYDVPSYFEKNGFEHIQGSGYHSTKAMSEAKAMAVIYRMTKEVPWLNYCVSVCTISDVPELYDISHVFEREAQQLSKKKCNCSEPPKGFQLIFVQNREFKKSVLLHISSNWWIINC